DVAKISDTWGLQNNTVRVNGKRAVYLNILKKSDASTLTVMDAVKDILPTLRAIAPKGIEINLNLDQSLFVRRAITSVLIEAVISSLLVALMILLFLKSWR